MTIDRISVADGKYTVISDNGKLSALRHGEPWQDLTGNNLVYWLAIELKAAREALAGLLPFTEELCDAGPEGAGWASDALKSARARAQEAIE